MKLTNLMIIVAAIGIITAVITPSCEKYINNKIQVYEIPEAIK